LQVIENGLKRTIYAALFPALAIASTAAAQTHMPELNGFITIKSGKKIPYKLQLTDSAGIVRGYSITYQEPEDAKAMIEGRIERATKKLIFTEKELLYSKGFHPEALCMISATLDYLDNGKTLKGKIASTNAANTACSGGTVTFNVAAEIENLYRKPEVPLTPQPKKEPTDKYDTVITMRKKMKSDTVALKKPEPQPVEPAPTDKVTAGVEKAYEWHSDTVIVDVWDGGNVDGDRVTILFNNIPVLENYRLAKERKRIFLPLSAGNNSLSILAVNEGSDPPNTATMLLTDGQRHYNIIAYNPKGSQSIIHIRKTK
jgi:hypothetical protein